MVTKHHVIEDSWPKDAALAVSVDRWLAKMGSQMDRVLGYVSGTCACALVTATLARGRVGAHTASRVRPCHTCRGAGVSILTRAIPRDQLWQPHCRHGPREDGG